MNFHKRNYYVELDFFRLVIVASAFKKVECGM